MACLIDSNSDSGSESEGELRMTEATINTTNRKIYNVQQIATKLKKQIQLKFPERIIVRGEITDLSHRNHLYLSLNGGGAVLNMIAWSSVANKFPKLRTGDSVVVEGKPDIYAPSGRLSFVIYKLDRKQDDIGDCQKLLLQNESVCRKWGAFDAIPKIIPTICYRLVIITSIEGDAICDVLSVVRPNSLIKEIIVIDSKVQGKFAPESIADSLAKASLLSEIGAILLTRGGGSTDDLSCFNQIEVLREIFNSPYPIITAIGHKRDISLSDRIADHNAITPTDAGKYLCRVDRTDVVSRVNTYLETIVDIYQRIIERFQRELDIRKQRLQHYSPVNQLNRLEQKYTHLQATLLDSVSHQISERHHAYANQHITTTTQIDNYRHRLNQQANKLLHTLTQRKTEYTDNIANATQQVYQSNLSIVTDTDGYTLDLSDTNKGLGQPVEAVVISNGIKHRVSISVIT